MFPTVVVNPATADDKFYMAYVDDHFHDNGSHHFSVYATALRYNNSSGNYDTLQSPTAVSDPDRFLGWEPMAAEPGDFSRWPALVSGVLQRSSGW
jgi:hypothetical protein